MQKIVINDDWFYHQISPFKLKLIAESGYLYSLRMQGKKKKFNSLSYNGNDYISLAKKGIDCKYYSSYFRFIVSHYALIFSDIEVIKPIVTRDLIDFYAHISNLNIGRRHSCFDDEYMVRNQLSLDKAIGIKIPEEEFEFASIGKFYDSNDITYGIDMILDEYKSANLKLPFIDIEKSLLLDSSEVKEYIIKRNTK